MTNPILLPNGAVVQVAPPRPPTIAMAPPNSAALVMPVPGAPGPPGTGTQIFNETPTGAVDGANPVFTTAHAFRADSTVVYINGLRERLNIGYTETTSTSITFTQAPTVGDELIIDYLEM